MRAIRFVGGRVIGLDDYRVRYTDSGYFCDRFSLSPANLHLLNYIRQLPGDIFEGWYRTTSKQDAINTFRVQLKQLLSLADR